MLADFLTVAVLAWFGTRLFAAAGQAVRGEGRARAGVILAGLRARHFVLALPVLGAVVAVALVLIQVPGLSFGWWTAIGGQGNPVIGNTARTRGSAAEWLIPLVFVALLVPALPLLVEREERIFRMGSERRSTVQQATRGVVFGLAHALVGIPIGAALALSVAGWYLTWAYLRGYRQGGPMAGVLESARAHLAYNSVILVLVAYALVTGSL